MPLSGPCFGAWTLTKTLPYTLLIIRRGALREGLGNKSPQEPTLRIWVAKKKILNQRAHPPPNCPCADPLPSLRHAAFRAIFWSLNPNKNPPIHPADHTAMYKNKNKDYSIQIWDLSIWNKSAEGPLFLSSMKTFSRVNIIFRWLNTFRATQSAEHVDVWYVWVPQQASRAGPENQISRNRAARKFTIVLNWAVWPLQMQRPFTRYSTCWSKILIISLKRGVTRFTTHQSASTARGQHDPAIRQGLCIRIKPFLYVKHFKNIKVSHKHCTKKSQKYDKNFQSPTHEPYINLHLQLEASTIQP